MDEQFKDLQCLLRLKRHEAPPPEYFEDFLIDFHRRQRAELLKRPMWRLMLDRIEGAIPTFSPSRYAYAGACATAVAATVLASSRILTSSPAVSTATVAETHQPAIAPVSVRVSPPPAAQVATVSLPRINIYNRQPVRISSELDFDRARPAVVSYASSRPRYDLDTQPVRYEQPFSF